MKRIARPELLGRERQLAELADFCLDPARGPYMWWQAGPWAGKSALLSTFVLHPPAQLIGRVWIVSFFITARLAAQDTRQAFTTVLLEQLCALTGQDLPATVGDATRDAHLLDLLGQTAAACQEASGRLVLVVDGLDEDRSVTIGPAAQSIAGLLPADPSAGMRVVIAGRPNPPIPDDVPDWHPLRDPGIIRLLSDSPHARDLQRLGQSELKRLLKGAPVERDLLGLLTAGRGGLSGHDLRELTGASLVDIEDVLHTVVGRTFTRRTSSWSAKTGPEVYLLGHEELHNAACRYLGPDRLADYRARLHSWADTYRIPGDGRPPWPATTPEYLLQGYPSLLQEIGDVHRLVTLATDPARHNRMLDLSGGDTAALAEIKATQDQLLTWPEPDLLALTRLSIRRQGLESRNTNIPPGLPSLWATIGHTTRAESLANSLTDPTSKARALAGVAQVLAAAGDISRARQLADTAEMTAHRIRDPLGQGSALTGIVRALTAAGDLDHAEGLARTLAKPYQSAIALAGIAREVAAAGDPDRARQLAESAEAIAHTVTDPDEQVEILARVVQAVAAAGDPDRARQLAESAEAIAGTITDLDLEARVLPPRAGGGRGRGSCPGPSAGRIRRDCRQLQSRNYRMAADAGRHRAGDGSCRKYRSRRKLARAITTDYLRVDTMAAVARTMAATGGTARALQLAESAEAVARTIASQKTQVGMLAAIAEVVVAVGDPVRARQLAESIEASARTITNPYRSAQALVGLAHAVATAGDPDLARQLADSAMAAARTITGPGEHAEIMAGVGQALVAAGDAHRAKEIASAISTPYSREKALAGIARAVAVADLDHATAIVHDIDGAGQQGFALIGVVEVVAASGDPDRAEAIARTISNPELRAEALTNLPEAVARSGDPERAEAMAGTITSPGLRAKALTDIARVVAAAGDADRARHLVESVEAISRKVTNQVKRDQGRQHWLASVEHDQVVVCVVRAVAAIGDADRAEAMARDITNLSLREEALANVVRAVAAAGDADRAEEIARTMTDPDGAAQAMAEAAEVAGPHEVCHLLGSAFAVGPWWIPLRVLAKLQPHLVLQIAAELCAPGNSTVALQV